MLLLAHGGPSRLEDVPQFLKQMTGRDPSPDNVRRVTERYRLTGGGSPATGTAAGLAHELERRCGFQVLTGMLYWHPFAEDSIDRMAEAAVTDVLAICLSPLPSRSSFAAYRGRTLAAANSAGVSVEVAGDCYATPEYASAVAGRVMAALADPAASECLPENGQRPHVVFTAHSLPVAIRGSGDPYESRFLETARAVAAEADLAEGDWTAAYQSAPHPAQRWLGPDVKDVLSSLASDGSRRVVVCPLSFVMDQVETLYDLDVALKEQATALGVQLVRATALNDSDASVELLARCVDRWLADKGLRPRAPGLV